MAYVRKQQPRTKENFTNSSGGQPRSTIFTQKRIRKWTILAGLVLFTVCWYCTPLASVISGAVVTVFMPRYMDILIGRAGVQSSRYQVASHSAHSNRIQRIGWELLDNVDPFLTEGFEFSFNVIGEPVVNAFAYPGGPIFITTQLLDRFAASDDEVAAVLAHEIGHVIARHSIKRILSDSFINILWAAAVYDDKDDHQETFGEAIGEVLLKYAVYLGTLAFSRANEYEADNYGWEILLRSRYNEQGMISFFTKLQNMEEAMGKSGGANINRSLSKAMWWYQTHPYTNERILSLKAKASRH